MAIRGPETDCNLSAPHCIASVVNFVLVFEEKITSRGMRTLFTIRTFPIFKEIEGDVKTVY